MAKARRRLRAPTSLKVLTWVAAVLVLAVLAGFAFQPRSPDWLATPHILRVAAPGRQPAASLQPSGPAATAGGGDLGLRNQAVAPRSTKGITGDPPPQSSALQRSVADDRFTVGVATSGRCWVQITSSTSPTPLVSASSRRQDPGFPAKGTMTVQVGSSAVLVGVTMKGKPPS